MALYINLTTKVKEEVTNPQTIEIMEGSKFYQRVDEDGDTPEVETPKVETPDETETPETETEGSETSDEEPLA